MFGWVENGWLAASEEEERVLEEEEGWEDEAQNSCSFSSSIAPSQNGPSSVPSFGEMRNVFPQKKMGEKTRGPRKSSREIPSAESAK